MISGFILLVFSAIFFVSSFIDFSITNNDILIGAIFLVGSFVSFTVSYNLRNIYYAILFPDKQKEIERNKEIERKKDGCI